jgi:flagellar motility protein MotE (MotC chaperone)
MSNLIKTFQKEAEKFDENLSFGTGNFNYSELKAINNYFDFLKRTVDRTTNSARNFAGNSKSILRSRKVLDLVNERVDELMNFVEVVPNKPYSSSKNSETSNLDNPEIEDENQQLQKEISKEKCLSDSEISSTSTETASDIDDVDDELEQLEKEVDTETAQGLEQRQQIYKDLSDLKESIASSIKKIDSLNNKAPINIISRVFSWIKNWSSR